MAIKINKDDLEKALRKKAEEKSSEKDLKESEISKEEEIGFHKGALNTLAAERNELIKMISNVEAIIQAHLKRLDELGVEIKKG